MQNFIKRKRTLAIGALLLAACSRAALAADPSSASAPPDKWVYTLFNPTPVDQLRDMDTDRPNITNTPHTIDAGHLQIETGFVDYAYYRDRSAGDNVRADDFSFWQFNCRLGVLSNLEINAVINAYDLDYFHDYAARARIRGSGFGDTVLGAKLNLWGDDGGDDVWATAMAIQPQFLFPTARNGHFEFSIAAPFLVNLPAGFHLGLQPGIADERNTANTGYVTGLQNSISIDRVFLDKLDVYFEYASDLTTEKRVKAVQSLDVGATYPLNDNIVFDTGLNFGLNRASTNIEVLAGISIRF